MGRRHRRVRAPLHRLRSSRRPGRRGGDRAGGSGTRQDARWIEHVDAAHRSGLALASYWHVYPSRAEAHHQAELWVAAIREPPVFRSTTATGPTSRPVTVSSAAISVGSSLRFSDAPTRCSAMPVGVFSSAGFWVRHVGFDDPVRPRWWDSEPSARRHRRSATGAGVRLSPSDRGGPGRHLVRPVAQVDRPALLPGLVVGADRVDRAVAGEVGAGPEIAVLQMHLNDLGARLVVDGVFGPQTDAAVRVCDLLCRRDRLPWPFGLADDAPAGACQLP